MFVFKSTRQRFYLIVGLLLLLFGITYIQLARFLNKLSTSTERVQAATLIDREVRWLGEHTAPQYVFEGVLPIGGAAS